MTRPQPTEAHMLAANWIATETTEEHVAGAIEPTRHRSGVHAGGAPWRYGQDAGPGDFDPGGMDGGE